MSFDKHKTRIIFAMPSIYGYFCGRGNGGAEYQIYSLASLFKKHGCDVTIVTNECKSSRGVEHHNGIKVIKIPLRHFGGNNIFFVYDSIRFCLKVSRLKPDFCFFKVPVTLIFHFWMVKLLYSKTKIVMIGASDKDFRHRNQMFLYLFYERLLSKLYTVVFQTKAQQELGEHNFALHGCVIPNIFSTNYKAKSLSNKEIDILWIGSYKTSKHPEKLLDIADILHNRNITVISKPCPDNMKTLEDKLKEKTNINYLGFVPFQETWNIILRSRLLISTSDMEGFPNVFLQAWYLGVPVVSLVYTCDGLIEKYSMGNVARDLKEMCKIIEQLLNSPKELASMGCNGQKYVATNHAPDMIWKKYLKLVFKES